VVVDRLCHYLHLTFCWRPDILSFCAMGDKVILIKPATWVNLSGNAVEKAAKAFSPKEIILIHDDMDILLGKLKIRMDGGNGGHKGVHSIIQHIGEDTIRVKLGIGRPRGDVVDYVLGEFEEDEKTMIDKVTEEAMYATLDIVENGLNHAMNIYNREKDEKV